MKTLMLALTLGSSVAGAYGQSNLTKSPCDVRPPFKWGYGCGADSVKKSGTQSSMSLSPYRSILWQPFLAPSLSSSGNTTLTESGIKEHKYTSPMVGQK